MRCLITGGAGFIGSHIQDKLIEFGHEVAIVDNLRSGKKENLHEKSKFFEVDVTDKEKLTQTFEEFKPEIVFHLAAQNEVPYSMEHPYEDEKMNIVGMMNLMEASAKVGVKKIIYSNTGGAFYGDVPEDHLPTKEDETVLHPTSFYGVSKMSAEFYMRLYGKISNISWVSLRYSNVYGPRQAGNKEAGVVAIFTTKMLNNETPTIFGDGLHIRDYVYVMDVADANIMAMDHKENDAFNICVEVGTTNNEVFSAIKEALNSDLEAEYGPERTGDARKVILSNQKAKEKLGWEPKTDFKTGVRQTVEYYQNN